MATNLDRIAAPLRAAGLTVVETPGWITRGYEGQDFQEIRGVVWHHTATNRAQFAYSDAPTLAMCIAGRPDVAGPLCNIVFGRTGIVYLVATGVANHAGGGWAGLDSVRPDMGNHYYVGIEMESSGIAPWDWTPDQVRLAPVLGAVLEKELFSHLPASERVQISHKEYSSEGKIDPAGWPGGMDGLRKAINARLVTGTVTPVKAPVKPAPKPVAQKPAAPVKAPVKPAHGPNDIHWVVGRGDTLGKIAKYYYGKAGTAEVNKIAAFNGIKNVNSLKPGQKIYIPGPLVWTVEAPDTYSSIAAYYGLDADYLARKNGDANRNSTIYIGNVIKIL